MPLEQHVLLNFLGFFRSIIGTALRLSPQFLSAAMAPTPRHGGRHNQLAQAFARCIAAERLDGARMSQLAMHILEGSRELAHLAAPYVAEVAPSAAPSLQADLQPMAAVILSQWRQQASGGVAPTGP